jgi:hypothetical protein
MQGEVTFWTEGLNHYLVHESYVIYYVHTLNFKMTPRACMWDHFLLKQAHF